MQHLRYIPVSQSNMGVTINKNKCNCTKCKNHLYVDIPVTLLEKIYQDLSTLHNLPVCFHMEHDIDGNL